jgi:hypothetical protein
MSRGATEPDGCAQGRCARSPGLDEQHAPRLLTGFRPPGRRRRAASGSPGAPFAPQGEPRPRETRDPRQAKAHLAVDRSAHPSTAELEIASATKRKFAARPVLAGDPVVSKQSAASQRKPRPRRRSVLLCRGNAYGIRERRASIALHRTPRAFSHWNPQRGTHHELVADGRTPGAGRRLGRWEGRNEECC